MSSSPRTNVNYRALYGKLFSGLLHHFGIKYVSEIEDAFQNTFLKSLKVWKQDNLPNHKENWLYIVARNDIVNQIKKRKESSYQPYFPIEEPLKSGHEVDLRLQTIVLISSLENVSSQSKIVFILKNIFGLSITEISNSTFIHPEAIYKNINRTKKNIQDALKGKALDLSSIKANPATVTLVDEILCAVFNIGFDSFRDTTLNEDLCLEAFALTKLFFVHSPSVLTSNLLALFCFHIARIPAKIESDKPVSFFNQARCKWDKKLISLGFQYLQKPLEVNKFYIEAVIVSKYMSKDELSLHDWKDIVKLYETLQNVTDSPVVKLSYCFCLSKINQTERALTLLSEIEKVIPRGHLYFTLIKARIIKESSPKESYDLFQSAMNNVNQEIRKDYLLENELLPFLTEIKE